MECRVDDYGYDIELNLKESDGTTALNLTNVTAAKFQVVEADSRRSQIDGACIVQTPKTDGQVKYTVLAGDFSKSGNFIGGVNLTYSSGKVITTKDIFITVNKKLT